MPDAATWLPDTNILLRMSKIDDPQYPTINGAVRALVAQGARTGRPLPTVDSLIAATALAYDLTIVTRNTRDFEGIGATLVNPWNVIAASRPALTSITVCVASIRFLRSKTSAATPPSSEQAMIGTTRTNPIPPSASEDFVSK